MAQPDPTDVAGETIQVTVQKSDPDTDKPAAKPTRQTQAPQKDVDDFWDKFNSKYPGKAFTLLPNNVHAHEKSAAIPSGNVSSQNAATSLREATEVCKHKVNRIAAECRRINQKYRDAHFDIESDLMNDRFHCLAYLNGLPKYLPPRSVKRVREIFINPKFYIDGAAADDVRQGYDGNCWFLAAVSALCNKEDLVNRVCVARDETVGVYGFVFYRDGEWISEVIDDKLYLTKPDWDQMTNDERDEWDELKHRKNPEEEYREHNQRGSRALHFAQCKHESETWLPLLEKAYAKAHGDYQAIDGGFVGEGLGDLTGGVTTELFTSDILDIDKFWKEEIMKVNEEFMFGCATGMNALQGDKGNGIYYKHAYSIMEAQEIDGKQLVKLRNPWGKSEWTGPWSDGSEEWTAEWMKKLDHTFGDDGVFWISYQDLLSKYQHLDRTRLFTAEWNKVQMWTSLSVPWTVDYLDTKFKITIAKEAEVVLVLSQLDTRYFKGLEGQYTFQLQFRLHKEGERDYILRSHGNYYMRRSVSAEPGRLEPGTYHVLVKIDAFRDITKKNPLDVVRETCQAKREKLLAVGLSYDLAHAKGGFKENEKEKRERQEQEKKERKKSEREKRQKQRRNEKLRRARQGFKSIKISKSTSATPSAPQIETPRVVQPPESEADSTAATVDESGPESDDAHGTTSEILSQDAVPPAPIDTTYLHARNNAQRRRLLTIDDVSDTEVTWDSERDGPWLADTRAEDFEQFMAERSKTDEEPDEFEADPWNAICVVGLRVYTKETKDEDVKIEVVRPVFKDEQEKKLDLDDRSHDATKSLSHKQSF